MPALLWSSIPVISFICSRRSERPSVRRGRAERGMTANGAAVTSRKTVQSPVIREARVSERGRPVAQRRSPSEIDDCLYAQHNGSLSRGKSVRIDHVLYVWLYRDPMKQ